MQLIIYTEKITPRVQYACKIILEILLGMAYKITDNRDQYINSELPKINYSTIKITDEIFIEPSGLLCEKGITSVNPDVSVFSETIILFETNKDASLPFDIFSAVFFLVSRYEEYKSESSDRYFRFNATESIAYINHFLEEPVVNIWTEKLKNILEKKYPELIFPKKNYNFLPTIDIDNAWAFLNKSFLRGVASTVKALIHLNTSLIVDRFRVISGIQKDPYDTYNYIEKIHSEYNLKPILFFLLGKFSKYDKNISPDNKNLRDLIRKMALKYPIGIHPSFNSNKKINILRQEIETLKTITEKPVLYSRQHFLKLSLPYTYRNLIEFGIKQDYTMGYPSLPGFRAGICTPFPFYDLLEEKETELIIFPFQVMDTTLKDYLNCTPDKAIFKIKELIDKVKKVDGTFISLWHNESLCDKRKWANWKMVYESLLEYAV